MSKNIIIYAVLVFFVFSMNVALSGPEYPPEMMEVSEPYPNAIVTSTVLVPGNMMVGMQSEDNLDKIFEFYKQNLTSNGWTISAETKQQGLSGLIGEKGSNSAVVQINTGQSGTSTIMLMLAPKK